MSWQKVLGIYGVVALVFFLLGRHTVKPDIITVPDIVVVDTIIHDTTFVPHPVVIPGTNETLYVDSTTPIGQIPVTTTWREGSIPIKIGDQMESINYRLGFTHRGPYYNYQLKVQGKELEYHAPRKLFWGEAVVWTDKDLNLGAQLLVGGQLGRFKPFVGVQHYDSEIQFVAGARITIF